MESPKDELGCVNQAVAILGDKWTPLLISALAQDPVRFCKLQDTAGVNPRTLSARLSFLEQEGIVTKTMYPEVPPRCEYALTQKGRDLLPILEGMAAWNKVYGPLKSSAHSMPTISHTSAH